MLTSTATPMPSSHARRPSRSNSTSSSSIITVQRTASRQSRSGSRNHINRTGTSSPVGSSSKVENGVSTPAPETTLHKQWTANPPTRDHRASVGGVRGGVGNLNRWSESTSSTQNSPPNVINEASQGPISHRASVANSLTGSLHSLKNLAHPQSSPPRSTLAQIRQSPTKTSPTSSAAPWLSDQSPTAPSEIITLPTPTDAEVPNLSDQFFSSGIVSAEGQSSNPSETWMSGLSPDKADGTGRYQDAETTSRTVQSAGSTPPQTRTSPEASRATAATYASSQKYHQQVHNDRERSRDPTPRPHRSRSRQKSSVNGGRGHTATGSSSSAGGERERGHRTHSHKTMLSKALQKANTAVLLDNATNFEGAIEAYNDACQLLQQVMHRTSGDERQKLEEIRSTYSTRIFELKRQDLVPQQAEGKALPERPLSEESLPGETFSSFEEEEMDEPQAVIETATATRIVNNPSYMSDPREPRSLAPSQIPPRRQSLLPSPMAEEPRVLAPSPMFSHSDERPTLDQSKQEDQIEQRTVHIPPRLENDFMPSPLSPRKYSPPAIPQRLDSASQKPSHLAPTSHPSSALNINKRHSRDTSNGSTSWLDTIDESGPSSGSSLHSRSSSLYLRRKQERGSHGTEAEFDAALDAAVEAAYDQGYVPAQYDEQEEQEEQYEEDDVLTNAKRNVELAKQRVREAEKEAEDAFRGRHRHVADDDYQHDPGMDSDYLDDEAEEEERLLEEMTQGYVMDDFEFGLQSKSALPRQSDSSGFSGRTWGSSVGSNTLTTGTSLSTLAEGVPLPSMDSQIQSKQYSRQPPQPPPTTALPPPPPLPSSSPPAPPVPSVPTPGSQSIGSPAMPGVRARRLSGQNTTQLRIDTGTHSNTGSHGPKSVPLSQPPTSAPPPIPKDEPKTSVPVSQDDDGNTATGKPSLNLATSAEHLQNEHSSTPSLTNTISHDHDVPPSPSNTIGKMPSAPNNLRKNISSSSLKALRTRNMSLSTPDDHSPSTPSSAMFSGVESRKNTYTSSSQTSQPASSGSQYNSQSSRAIYLFGNDIHSPTTPGSPNPQTTNAPLPLEPCPESFLLRPFWLTRALYQTIAHPRGGYLSTKLFVPRDVWSVKNVKLKAVEEKISACDLLTAALLKLSQVDTYDADAVLEEMQAFENILDQLQGFLTKKLGSDVGVQGSMPLFSKLPTNPEDSTTPIPDLPAMSKSSSSGGKSYLTSWRKLRSKNSGAGTAAAAQTRDGVKDSITINSLPMTSVPSSGAYKRNITPVPASGPNANYMNALVRLFDATNVLDQIASQVEDPGLKHSSQTHVGLELSTRHAAEFFGFYICRFVLNDIGIMLDKFIKRGSEWVLI